VPAFQQSLDDLGTPLVDVEFAVLDLETTGGSPADDRITEVGVVKVRGGQVTGTFQTLVNPGRSIPPMIVALTGISDGMVAGSEPIEVVLPCLLEFIGQAVIVAHNSAFDLRFLQANLERHGYARLANRTVCTARLARRVLPRDEVPNVRLATLASYLRASTVPCHRALTDAKATVDVLHALLERAGSFGVLALEDLLDFPKASSQAAFVKVGLARDLPRTPGVYRFRDARGQVLYVGKAKDLRARVRSYFSGDSRAKVADLLRELASIDVVPCATDFEASVREVRLIQHHRPRYNRRSREPERYCYLKLTRERWPRLSVVRRVLGDGAHYLGPFWSAHAAEQVKLAIEDTVPLRRCTATIGARTRFGACALLELRRCLGPCTGQADPEVYARLVATVAGAIDGDPGPLLDPLKAKMARYSDERRYEQAALVRDRLEALTRALAETRRAATVCAVDELVVARVHPRGREVTVLRNGQLAGVVIVPADAAPGSLDGSLDAGRLPLELDALPGEPALERFAGPAPRHLADEVRLVSSWLHGVADEVELLAVTGTLASPAAGGASLQLRRDPGRARAGTMPGEARGRPLLRQGAGRRRRRAQAAPVPSLLSRRAAPARPAGPGAAG
jgi:DNA polymerase-3 subunit epsilon